MRGNQDIRLFKLRMKFKLIVLLYSTIAMFMFQHILVKFSQ